jgi:predicted nucleotidyltransferase
MRPSEALQTYRDNIRQIVLAHHVTNVRFFGSVLTGDDTEESDLDLLVDPTAETSLMDIGAIRYKLKMLLGVNVDVLTPNSLPESFRDKVIKEAMPV